MFMAETIAKRVPPLHDPRGNRRCARGRQRCRHALLRCRWGRAGAARERSLSCPASSAPVSSCAAPCSPTGHQAAVRALMAAASAPLQRLTGRPRRCCSSAASRFSRTLYLLDRDARRCAPLRDLGAVVLMSYGDDSCCGFGMSSRRPLQGPPSGRTARLLGSRARRDSQGAGPHEAPRGPRFARFVGRLQAPAGLSFDLRKRASNTPRPARLRPIVTGPREVRSSNVPTRTR